MKPPRDKQDSRICSCYGAKGADVKRRPNCPPWPKGEPRASNPHGPNSPCSHRRAIDAERRPGDKEERLHAPPPPLSPAALASPGQPLQRTAWPPPAHPRWRAHRARWRTAGTRRSMPESSVNTLPNHARSAARQLPGWRPLFAGISSACPPCPSSWPWLCPPAASAVRRPGPATAATRCAS
jgi:hypothetical protein